MTTPCSSAVAPTTQKTALLVASGGDVDELIYNEKGNEVVLVKYLDALKSAIT